MLLTLLGSCHMMSKFVIECKFVKNYLELHLLYGKTILKYLLGE